MLIVAGAMVARSLSPRLAAITALVLSLVIVTLTWFYYRLNVHSPVVAGYGFYLGAVFGGRFRLMFGMGADRGVPRRAAHPAVAGIRLG